MELKSKRSFLADKKALVRLSVGFFVIATIVSVIVFASGVFANHISIAVVAPNLVKANTTYTFNVTVSNDASSEDAISEFRIYKESFGSNPFPFAGIVCNPKSGWNGPFIISSSEGDYCLYTAQSSGNRIGSGESQNFSFDATSPSTASCRTLKFESRDPKQFWRPIEDDVCVDNQAPITTKHFEGPQKIENGVEWIDGISTVVLGAEDPQPHPTGVDKTFYKLSGPVDNNYCYNVCGDWQKSSLGSGGWTEYTTPLGNISESCHVLEFYSTDDIGNIEEVKTNCFFVDKTPPEIAKFMNKSYPKVGTCPPAPGASWDNVDNICYINSTTPIELHCTDQEPHPSGGEVVWWRYRTSSDGQTWSDWLPGELCEGEYANEGWCDWNVQKPIKFPESSLHELQWYCEDAVEKKSETDKEFFRVDNEAPIITKTMIGDNHLGDCPPNSEGDKCYVADNGVRISVEDPKSIHSVDRVSCNYELWWEGKNIGSGQFGEEGMSIIFTEDSTHTLKVWCEDGLGNQVYDEEEFLVDSTPPITTKTYGTPAYPADINTGGKYPHYITSQTQITLAATDAKVGTDKTYYRYGIVEDSYCYGKGGDKPVLDKGFTTYTSSFTIPEESCHMIEFYSTDLLGNTENPINYQFVFVDNTAPIGEKKVGLPSFEGNNDPINWYVNTRTPITLSCNDKQPHPVDHSKIHWRFSWWPNGFTGEPTYSEWFSSTQESVEVYFEQDSWHDLEFYCEDALGNKGEIDLEYFIVDTKAPEIEVEVTGPEYCPEQGETCYIDTTTQIFIKAEDPQPHPVDDVSCQWRYRVNEGDWSQYFSTMQVIFPEESYHKLEVVCKDALGNSNTHYSNYFVDKTPPKITKEYGIPYFKNQFEDYWAEWINNETPIYISVVDDGPHKSGINKVEYRTSIVDDKYCRYQNQREFEEDDCEDAVGAGLWRTSEKTKFEFNIEEQSCRLIEIVATDNVEKSSTHKQCVFVDNTAPEPNKTVGEIKTIWDGKNGTFYKNETEHCWEKDQTGKLVGIECWRVTVDTPITLDCQDPEPHPVDHEQTCFMVGLDGVDATEDYCRDRGKFNESGNGYCCGFEAPYTFNFREESEHNLKFYCEDALGNKGKVDEEKFKVFGKMWKIPIYKKWNLISVPFDPLNKDVEKVFSEIEEDVEAVWTYNGDDKKWYVYRPGVDDGDDTNNLEDINTGVGYWVLALEDNTLVIGGGLLSPGPIVPPSNNLEKGWNLIGHYGTDPSSNLVYCSLYSLIDTNLGYPRWSALFGYDALSDSFERLNPWDSTNAGKGYWVEMDVDDQYSPATLCWGYFP